MVKTSTWFIPNPHKENPRPATSNFRPLTDDKRFARAPPYILGFCWILRSDYATDMEYGNINSQRQKTTFLHLCRDTFKNALRQLHNQ
jgi:hypothetical protein